MPPYAKNAELLNLLIGEINNYLKMSLSLLMQRDSTFIMRFDSAGAPFY